MTTCEEFPKIEGFSCMDGWLVALVSIFLGNGHARCAELTVGGPPEGAATNPVP